MHQSLEASAYQRMLALEIPWLSNLEQPKEHNGGNEPPAVLLPVGHRQNEDTGQDRPFF